MAAARAGGGGLPSFMKVLVPRTREAAQPAQRCHECVPAPRGEPDTHRLCMRKAPAVPPLAPAMAIANTARLRRTAQLTDDVQQHHEWTGDGDVSATRGCRTCTQADACTWPTHLEARGTASLQLPSPRDLAAPPCTRGPHARSCKSGMQDQLDPRSACNAESRTPSWALHESTRMHSKIWMRPSSPSSLLPALPSPFHAWPLAGITRAHAPAELTCRQRNNIPQWRAGPCTAVAGGR